MRRRALLAALVAAGVLVPAAGVGGQACEQPHPPVYVQRGYPFNDPAPPVQAASVSTAPPGFTAPPDFDGDGTSDLDPAPAIPGPLPATVRRPSGDITFVRAGSGVQVMLAGDLDGAPGQEIWVMVLGGTGVGAPIAAEAYVVPYGTAAGTYDPADVGIRVEPGLAWPVPDRTGDGVADVLAVDTASVTFVGGTTRVLSGAAILATAVGDDARPTSTVATIPGGAQATADLGGAQSAIVTVQDIGRDLEVRVIQGTTTTVFTNRPAVVGFSPAELQPGGVQVLAGPSGRFVTASASSRSGGGAYWWSLDDPCSPLGGGDQLPASRPAAPVAGTPRYTG